MTIYRHLTRAQLRELLTDPARAEQASAELARRKALDQMNRAPFAHLYGGTWGIRRD